MLARALALKPAVVSLDEPTALLDERSRDAAERTLIDLRYRLPAALMVVTHDPSPSDAAEQSDHVPTDAERAAGIRHATRCPDACEEHANVNQFETPFELLRLPQDALRRRGDRGAARVARLPEAHRRPASRRCSAFPTMNGATVPNVSGVQPVEPVGSHPDRNTRSRLRLRRGRSAAGHAGV
jgi:hypothetical protein